MSFIHIILSQINLFLFSFHASQLKYMRSKVVSPSSVYINLKFWQHDKIVYGSGFILQAKSFNRIFLDNALIEIM